jgi:hypothetical protein
MAACLICRSEAHFSSDGSVKTYECPRCGRYELPRSGGWDDVEIPNQQVPISAWIRHQNAMGDIPFITLEILRRVRCIPIPNLRDRANFLLVALAKKYPRFNDGFVISTLCDDLLLQAVTYSAVQRELNDLFAVLQNHDGFIELRTTGSPPHALTVKGLLAADQLKTINAASSQGFVAMSFDPELVAAWTNGFDPAIRAAGYTPRRIDAKEYVGGISDEIMAEIRRSRFVVADYTQQKNGVYFEAGFALGLGLTVIPTCRADEIGQLHFDIRHLNTLAWIKPDDLAVKLSQRIRGVIGAGPRV